MSSLAPALGPMMWLRPRPVVACLASRG